MDLKGMGAEQIFGFLSGSLCEQGSMGWELVGMLGSGEG